MTREEERYENIYDAAAMQCYPYEDGCLYGFIEGAKWADEHPKKSCWINVEDKLPCDFPEIIHFGFTNRVFVKSQDDKYGVSFMIKKKDRWEWEGKIPKYWMFIPK